MTTQTGYIYLLTDGEGKYSLEQTTSPAAPTQHFEQLVHSFRVDQLQDSYYFLVGRFLQNEGAEWEALSPTAVDLFKRIRGGSLESIIADVVLPDRPRLDMPDVSLLIRDLTARTWTLDTVCTGGFVLRDQNGLLMNKDEWDFLSKALDHGYRVRNPDAIAMNNWIRCGELIKPE